MSHARRTFPDASRRSAVLAGGGGLLSALAGGSGLLLPSTAAYAQATKFPVKPVRVIAGFAPGGALDLNARIAAQAIQEQLGQPGIVENRAGASGVIGTERRRAPVASKMAFATAAGMAVGVGSPAPQGCSVGRSISTTSTLGASLKRRIG
jgi:hypothetical protein